MIRTRQADGDLLLPPSMSRLASLQGPSSPSPNPVRAPRSPAKSPKASRSKEVSIYDRLEANTTPPTETTYHRKLRTLLLELKAVANSWNDVLLGEGLKAAKGLTDARTELTSVRFLANCHVHN